MSERSVEATDGWTPLEFYGFILRTLGIPRTFRFNGDHWVADSPFTKPSQELLTQLEQAEARRLEGPQ